MIDLLGQFKSVSTLTFVLSAFMAFPSNIPLFIPFGSTTVSWESPDSAKASWTIHRKLDRMSLLEWADSSAVGDDAEETDGTPLPLAILPRFDDRPSLIPSTIQAGPPPRPEVFAIGSRNPPLRC